MRKSILGIIAIIVVGIVIASLPRKCTGEETQVPDTAEEDDDSFYVETLSDQDIYFKADTTLPDSSLFSDLMDAANGYAILRAAYCDAELWFRFHMPVKNIIAKIRTGVIRDSDIRTATERYKERLVSCLPNDTSFESPDSKWDYIWNAYKNYADTLSRRYSISRYGQITEKDVQEYQDRKRFIPNYDSICQLRKRWLYITEDYLEKMAGQSANFDEKCLYTVELAHQRIHEVVHHPYMPKLEELMKEGRYSCFLHEVWRTWRVLKQMEESPSVDGKILNLEYNRMRFICLNTILKQIVKNPKDIMAINEFFFLASYNNIIRYSEFSFGNSALLEFLMLYPEALEDFEEEDSLSSECIDADSMGTTD